MATVHAKQPPPSALRSHYNGLASVLANPEAFTDPQALSDGDLILMQSHVQSAHYSLGRVMTVMAGLIQANSVAAASLQMPAEDINDAAAELLYLAGGVLMELGDIGQILADEECMRLSRST